MPLTFLLDVVEIAKVALAYLTNNDSGSDVLPVPHRC